MDSFTIDNFTQYKNTPYNNNYKNSNADTTSSENLDNTISKRDDDSNISDDAVIGYKFLTRIESSMHNASKDSIIDKYISEYQKIKKEISSGTYGNDINKYKALLDNVFKNSLTNMSNSLTKSSTASATIKLTPSALRQCQTQYENATGLTWMFRAENKRILREIEYYKRKKNHRLVNSLTQLSNAYKHIINNVSGTATYIKTSIDDTFSPTSDASKNLDSAAKLLPLSEE